VGVDYEDGYEFDDDDEEGLDYLEPEDAKYPGHYFLIVKLEWGRSTLDIRDLSYHPKDEYEWMMKTKSKKLIVFGGNRTAFARWCTSDVITYDTLLTLASVHTIPRIGVKSSIRMLTMDMISLLKRYLTT
jgi:hypothetical protein